MTGNSKIGLIAALALMTMAVAYATSPSGDRMDGGAIVFAQVKDKAAAKAAKLEANDGQKVKVGKGSCPEGQKFQPGRGRGAGGGGCM